MKWGSQGWALRLPQKLPPPPSKARFVPDRPTATKQVKFELKQISGSQRETETGQPACSFEVGVPLLNDNANESAQVCFDLVFRGRGDLDVVLCHPGNCHRVVGVAPERGLESKRNLAGMK